MSSRARVAAATPPKPQVYIPRQGGVVPLAIVVYGRPAPQGSKRFAGMRNGRGVMVESSKAVAPWRELVWAAALAARDGAAPLDGPLAVRMVFTVPKPTAAPKRRQTWPDRMPDLSKLARSTEDALTNAGVWKDDARIVQYDRLAKVYPNEDPEALEAPGVRIEVRDLNRSPLVREGRELELEVYG